MAVVGQFTYNLGGMNHDAETLATLQQGLIATNKENSRPGQIPADSIIIRLGIQAPPGTQFQLNGAAGNLIIIGRSGIYELDERVNLNQLQLIAQPIYRLNEAKTKEAQQKAIENFKEFQKKVDELKFSNSTEWDNGLISWVDNMQPNNDTNIDKGLELYNVGYLNYLQGKHGVYEVQKDENNENIIYEPIRDIIIDYVYEQTASITSQQGGNI